MNFHNTTSLLPGYLRNNLPQINVQPRLQSPLQQTLPRIHPRNLPHPLLQHIIRRQKIPRILPHDGHPAHHLRDLERRQQVPEANDLQLHIRIAVREHVDRARGRGAAPVEPLRGRVEGFDDQEERVVDADGFVLRLEHEREAGSGDAEAGFAGEKEGGGGGQTSETVALDLEFGGLMGMVESGDYLRGGRSGVEEK